MEERGDEHLLIFVGLNRWGRRDIMEDREKYKYPLPPNSYLSVAVPRCGSASLQVWHCSTQQDSNGAGVVKLAVLAEV